MDPISKSIAPLNNNPLKTIYSDYPQVILTVIFLSSHILPRALDPEGERYKRSMLKRFFTITLPDNIALVSLLISIRVQNLTIFRNPPNLFAATYLAISNCFILDLMRFSVAWGIDQVSETQNYVDAKNVKNFVSFIGPRDFYAIQRSDD